MKMSKREMQQRILAVEGILKANGLMSDQEQAGHDEVIAILDSKEPKPRQLDQSIFDGQDAKWRWAAIDGDGQAALYSEKPSTKGVYQWASSRLGACLGLELGYDTSSWESSLIERQDKPELTGSALVRAMLERGDVCVPCCVSDASEAHALETKNYQMVYSATSSGGCSFETRATNWRYAVPINPRTGEPLTATEAGF